MTGSVRNTVLLLAATLMTTACGSDDDCEVNTIAMTGYPTSANVNMTVAFTGTITSTSSPCVDSLTMDLTTPDGTVTTLHPSLVGNCSAGLNIMFSIGITPTMVGAHQFEIRGKYNSSYFCEDSNSVSGSFAVSN